MAKFQDIAPTPWGFGGSGAPDGEVWVWASGGDPTQDNPGGEDTRLFSATPEVAELVVQAVNSIHAMRAALVECLDSEERRRRDLKDGSPASTYSDARLARVRAAIAAAEASNG